MNGEFELPITYFMSEGRENLKKCVQISLNRAFQCGVQTVVVFTAEGEGAVHALDLIERAGHATRLVCATFPPGRKFSKFPDLAFNERFRERLVRCSVPIVDTWQPFDLPRSEEGMDAEATESKNEKRAWRAALSTLSAGVPLAVEAALMACDEGHVEPKANIVTVTASTGLLVRTCKSADFPGQFIIREIICKPAILDITRKEVGPKKRE